MDTPEAIGERIRDIRRQRGITQEGLAEAVGVSRSAVAQWETGRAGQVNSNLTRVADVLGVHVAVLLGANPRGAPPAKLSAAEMALVRLFRDLGGKDQQELLRTGQRLSKAGRGTARGKARAAKAAVKAPAKARPKAVRGRPPKSRK
jgi:transcriptional regulator with XRE-family HTH domain